MVIALRERGTIKGPLTWRGMINDAFNARADKENIVLRELSLAPDGEPVCSGRALTQRPASGETPAIPKAPVITIPLNRTLVD